MIFAVELKGKLMSDYIDRQNVLNTIADDDLVNKYYKNVATTLTTSNLLIGGNASVITSNHDEIAELREMIERLKGKPYYMKIQCHNCGAPLVIESGNHLIKCRYCHTAYFSGTQLVNSI